jgi:hypothetical protein
MQSAVGIITAAIISAAIYGVLFSVIYPYTPVSDALVTLFAVAGLATSLIISGIWRAVRRR